MFHNFEVRIELAISILSFLVFGRFVLAPNHFGVAQGPSDVCVPKCNIDSL